MKTISNEYLRDRIRAWLQRSNSDGLARPRGEAFALGSNVGLVRSMNQDRAVVARLMLLDVPCLVAVVFDGMGGMRDGAQCADLALAAFMASLISTRKGRGVPPQSLRMVLSEAVSRANLAVHTIYRGEGGAAGVGFVLSHGRVLGFNVGDCRAYVLDRESGVRQVSFDDTLAAHVAAVSKHVDATDTRNQLLQYIGFGSELEPHFFEEPLTPDIKGLLLTTDGAHGFDSGRFAAEVTSSTAVRELVERLLNLSRAMGGRDNATAVAISTKDDAPVRGLSDVVEFWSPASALEMLFVTEPSPLDTAQAHSGPPDRQRKRRGKTPKADRPGHQGKATSKGSKQDTTHPDLPNGRRFEISVGRVNAPLESPNGAVVSPKITGPAVASANATTSPPAAAEQTQVMPSLQKAELAPLPPATNSPKTPEPPPQLSPKDGTKDGNNNSQNSAAVPDQAGQLGQTSWLTDNRKR